MYKPVLLGDNGGAHDVGGNNKLKNCSCRKYKA